ncbi:hypothetical protein L1887_34704 [Cichorium endivia]|nr:hypothetical protein L1887_34704 [Cichorium endivia]
MEALTKDCLQTSPFATNVTRAEFTALKPDFVWGSATSAYQVEGAASEFGRSPSIWDTFCIENPAGIVNGDTGFRGTDAYFKTKEDVQMMKKMGINAYRFSISWSRVLPGGRLNNGVNKEGVEYYNNLIDELILHGITPYVTLFHWDTPNCLEQEYLGFLDKKIICDFKSYVEFCFYEFGDRVVNWITLNEPANYSISGYDFGAFAPGRGAPGSGVGNAATEPYIVAHNLLLCHAAAVELYRKRFQASQGGKIGITLDAMYYLPLDPQKVEDKDAALRGLNFHFGWFMEPLFSGKYPDIMRKNAGDRLPKFTKEQAKLVKGAYDFLGLNYYCSNYATTAEATDVVSYSNDIKIHAQPDDLNGDPIGPHGGVYWFYSYPPGLYDLLMHIKRNYGDPVIKITENGWPDQTDNTMKIEDALVDNARIDYYDAHLQNVLKAMKDGVKVDGTGNTQGLDTKGMNFYYLSRREVVAFDSPYKDKQIGVRNFDTHYWLITCSPYTTDNLRRRLATTVFGHHRTCGQVSGTTEQGQLLEPYLETIISPLTQIVRSMTFEQCVKSNELLSLPECTVQYFRHMLPHSDALEVSQHPEAWEEILHHSFLILPEEHDIESQTDCFMKSESKTIAKEPEDSCLDPTI